MELKIKQCAQDHPEPIQELCPLLTRQWLIQKNGKKIPRFHMVNEGKVYTGDCPVKKADFNNANGDLNHRRILSDYNKGWHDHDYAQYRAYYEDSEILEISWIKISKSKPDMKALQLPKLKWEYGSPQDSYFENKIRFFFLKGSSIPYTEDGEPYHPEYQGRKYNRKFLKDVLNLMYRFNAYQTGVGRAQMIKFDGKDLSSAPANDYTYSLQGMKSWYREKNPPKITKTTIANEKLLGTPLKSLDELAKECPRVINRVWGGTRYTYTSSDNCMYTEVVNDDLLVIRGLRRNWKNYSECEKAFAGLIKSIDRLELPDPVSEDIRIYINKGKVKIFQNKGGKFKVINTARLWSYSEFKNLEALSTNKYTANIVKDNPHTGRGLVLEIIKVLRHEPLKTLCENGLNKLASQFEDHEVNKITSEVFLTNPSPKEKDIVKAYGMTVEQLKLIENERDLLYVIPWLKRVYGTDISTMSLEDFENLFNKISILIGVHDIKYYRIGERWFRYRYEGILLTPEDQKWYQKIFDLIKNNRINVKNANQFDRMILAIASRITDDLNTKDDAENRKILWTELLCSSLDTNITTWEAFETKLEKGEISL